MMSPEAAEHMANSITRSNDGLLRSAALTRDGAPTAVLQFLRVIRDTNHPHRQLFRSAKDLIRWLDAVMTPMESRRLRDLLSSR